MVRWYFAPAAGPRIASATPARSSGNSEMRSQSSPAASHAVSKSSSHSLRKLRISLPRGRCASGRAGSNAAARARAELGKLGPRIDLLALLAVVPGDPPFQRKRVGLLGLVEDHDERTARLQLALGADPGGPEVERIVCGRRLERLAERAQQAEVGRPAEGCRSPGRLASSRGAEPGVEDRRLAHARLAA